MTMSPQAALRTLDDLRRFNVATVSGEALCLSLGDGLGQAFEEFQRLTQSFKAIEGVFTGDELKTLSAAIGEVSGSVSSMTGGLVAECEGIETLVRLSETIEVRFDLIRRSIRTIAALATNSRVEAACIDSRAGEVSAFAVELVNLAAQAQKAIDGCCREHGALLKTLRNSRNTLIEFKHLHSEELSAAERDLGAVDAALSDHRQHIAGAATLLAGRSSDIAAAIGKIVTALQIGDSTRQRVEHALQGLTELPSLYTNADDIQAARAIAGRLSALLLEGAGDDFADDAGRLSTSLLDLAHQANEIVAMGGQVGRKEKGEGRSFIEGVQDKLGAALALSKSSGAARVQVDAAVTEMIKSTESLDHQTGDLSDLTVAMTMIGINAILKAKRVGTAGLGLGVIADQLRAVADKVVVEVNEVKPLLGKAVAQTRTLSDLLAGRRGDTMDRGNMIASQALESFASRDNQVGLAMKTLIESGGRVARDIESAAARPDAHAAGVAMNELRDTLADVAAALSRDGSPRPDLERLEAAFAKRYTMAAERQIHAQFWSREGVFRVSRNEAA